MNLAALSYLECLVHDYDGLVEFLDVGDDSGQK